MAQLNINIPNESITELAEIMKLAGWREQVVGTPEVPATYDENDVELTPAIPAVMIANPITIVAYAQEFATVAFIDKMFPFVGNVDVNQVKKDARANLESLLGR
jgi:hypothetical protein